MRGAIAEEIPEGFEIYEHPANGQVFLRKKIPPLIMKFEKKVVENELKKLDSSRLYIADVKGKEIIIYQSNQNIDNLKEIFGSSNYFHDPSLVDDIIKIGVDYAPIMKFILDDEKKRTFVVNRYCFRSSIDDWIDISSPKPLKDVSKEFIKHLDKESLFELF